MPPQQSKTTSLSDEEYWGDFTEVPSPEILLVDKAKNAHFIAVRDTRLSTNNRYITKASTSLMERSSERRYPRMDGSDILTSAMRAPTASQPARRKALPPVTIPDTDTESDTDNDEDYSSPLSLSPVPSRQASPTAFNRTIAGPYSENSSRLMTPYNMVKKIPSAPPSPLSFSESDEAPTDTETAMDARPTGVASPQPAPLFRARTMPNTSDSSTSRSMVNNNIVKRAYSTNETERIRQNLSATPSRAERPFDTSSTGGSGYVIIAHNAGAQELLDNHSLSWGCQYEIARGISQGWWSWEEVKEKHMKFGSFELCNQLAAPLIPETMGKPGLAGSISSALWEELDREQEAIVENRGRGLGLQGEWKEKENWHGGRIQQMARIVYTKGSKQPFSLQLLGMQMSRSHRFARFLGSRRMLQVKFPKNERFNIDLAHLKKWLENKFVLCGRVFVPFATKEETVYMMEIDEDYEREPSVAEGDHLRLSLHEFVNWHNPIDLNAKQTLNKYAARFDLGLSTSIPALLFEAENINIIDDEYVPAAKGRKAQAHEIHTDGCGWMNAAALMTIARYLVYPEVPTAIQGRFLGSKGVWLLHPEDHASDSPPRIWIRASQRKINLIHPELFSPNLPVDPEVLRGVHPAHLIFDVVAPSKVTMPTRLNRLTLANLSDNCVPSELFIDLMEDTLRREVEDLTRWDGPGAMPLLWNAVNKATKTTHSRIQRNAFGLQRALGLASRMEDDVLAEDEFLNDDENDESVRADSTPVTLGEKILQRLQAGFSPKEDHQLYQDIKYVIKNMAEKAVSEYHITVPASVEMFIVPDPYGVLEEGQIQCRSSEYLMDPLYNLHPNILQGEVLIYRNPARLPSDVQKVQAVSHPLLARYVNVIVLPTKGAQSLASLMAGGDVDGDVAVCIFDPRLVQPFRPAPVCNIPDDLMNDFEPEDSIPRVSSVLREMKTPSLLARHLLIGLADHKIGLYSRMHENAVYRYGYADPRVTRMAHKFNINLDARKSGLVIRQKVFRDDSREYLTAPPPCLLSDNTRAQDGLRRTKRDLHTPFVLDELRQAGLRIQEQIMTDYHNLQQILEHEIDRELLKPYTTIANIPAFRQEVGIIEKAVQDMCRDYGRIWANSPTKQSFATKDKETSIKAQQNKDLQALAERFARPLEGVEILTVLGCFDEVKASYAYGFQQKFAFNVAFQQLCQIKAKAKGAVAFTREFADSMSMPGSAVRVLKQRAAIAGE